MNGKSLLEKIKEYKDLTEGRGFLRFFKETCKVFHPGRGLITPEIYPIFEEIVKAFFENHFVIILKSRQLGISTLSANLALYSCIFFPGTAVGVVSRRKDDAITFLDRARWTWNHLPWFFKPKLLADNRLSLVWVSGSKFLTSAPTKDAFRGETLSILIIDEAGACRNIDKLYSSAYLTLSKNFERFRTRQAPYGILIISTGGFLTDPSVRWFKSMWDEAKSGSSPYKAFKVHWRDVNLDEEWYKKQCLALNNDPDLIRTELDCEFISRGASSGVFDAEVLSKIKNSVEKYPVVDWNFYLKYVKK